MSILLLLDKNIKDHENVVTLSQESKIRNATLLICLEDNYYCSAVFKGKKPIYCMNKYMSEVSIELALKLTVHLEGVYFDQEYTKTDIANQIATHLLHKDFPFYSYYFSGSNSNSRASEYISLYSYIRCVPLEQFRFPHSEVEVFAFMTGYIPCIYKEKGNYFLTTQSDAIINKINFVKLWIDEKHLNKDYRITHKDVDAMLLILDKISNITVLGPIMQYKKITVEIIKDYVIKTIKLVTAKYPVRIGSYYISNANTIVQSMIIASRYDFCLLYRKHIVMKGRNTTINSYANFAYIDVCTFEDKVDTIFKSLKINPTLRWEQAMEILQNTIDAGILVKLANLIRRRLIWKNGNSLSCLPRYLFKPISWNFDDKAIFLPGNSRSFIMRHVLIQLERYLRPNLLDVIINGFMSYDLRHILKKIRWDNDIVKKLCKQDKPISIIFTLTKNNSVQSNSIYDNYINWIKFIYNTLDEQHDLYPVFSLIENIDLIKEEMPSFNNFIKLSAKDIQILLNTTSIRKKLIK